MWCPYTESQSCNSFELISNAYVHFFSAENITMPDCETHGRFF